MILTGNDMRFSRLYRHKVIGLHKTYSWLQDCDTAFSDLILSWNAQRPHSGFIRFSVRTFADEWLPWIDLAEWGESQNSFGVIRNSHYHLDVDHLKQASCVATRFEIRAEAIGVDVFQIDNLWASVSNPIYLPSLASPDFHSYFIKGINGFSQHSTEHPRNHHFCSPTSLHTVLNYHKLNSSIVELARKAYDTRENIYGHWPFNIAAAYEFSQQNLPCAVHRLTGFDDLVNHLKKNIPVVVSVKGAIAGAPKIYEQGHLMTVIGWDKAKHEVICLDSAFKESHKVMTAYSYGEFMKVWRERFHLCYLFFPSSFSEQL